MDNELRQETVLILDAMGCDAYGNVHSHFEREAYQEVVALTPNIEWALDYAYEIGRRKEAAAGNADTRCVCYGLGTAVVGTLAIAFPPTFVVGVSAAAGGIAGMIATTIWVMIRPRD